jgi:hypothetical protein
VSRALDVFYIPHSAIRILQSYYIRRPPPGSVLCFKKERFKGGIGFEGSRNYIDKKIKENSFCKIKTLEIGGGGRNRSILQPQMNRAGLPRFHR